MAGGLAGAGAPPVPPPLNSPDGLARDPQGTLYIADSLNHRLRKVAPNGTITPVAGGGTTPVCPGQAVPALSANLAKPTGVAVDGQGNLYLAEWSGVIRVDPTGAATRVAGQCNTYGFSGDGGPATAAQVYIPLAVAVDRQGNLFIADTRNHRIRKVGVDGRITTVAGRGAVGLCGDGGPATSACLHNPTGVAVDALGTLYIYDEQNARIRAG